MNNRDEFISKKPKAMILDFNSLRQMAFDSGIINPLELDALPLKVTKQELMEWLKKPIQHEKKLRQLSNLLYISNPSYQNIINLHRDMLLFYYIVKPSVQDLSMVNIKEFMDEYTNLLLYFDKMNISHEMRKVLNIALIEDVFFGYEHRTKDSYFIQKLNPDNCKISSVADGVYNFKFDFSYFDTKEGKEELKKYPAEFKRIYNNLTKKKKRNRVKNSDKWVELNPKNTICIKINEHIDGIIPPFIGLYAGIYDIEDYKALNKAKEEIGGYQLLIEQIPVDSKSGKTNDFLIEFDDALKFHKLANQTLPEQIGLMLSPMEITPVQFKQETMDKDSVGKVTRDFYNNAGINQLLFNSENSGTIGLNRNIEVLESYMFTVLRQIERWFNRKIKSLNLKYDYSIKFFDITIFNKSDFKEEKLTLAQNSLPFKLETCIADGMKQSEVMNMAYLENEVLKLNDLFEPLKSTHTQSSKDDSSKGAPEKKENELSEEGIKTKDNNANQDKAK